MTDYVKREINNIEAIASRCTESQADGYSQIMRICEALQEEIDEAYKKPQFEGATWHMRCYQKSIMKLKSFTKTTASAKMNWCVMKMGILLGR